MTSTQVAEMSIDKQLKCSSYNFTQPSDSTKQFVNFFLYLIITSTNNKFITKQVNPKSKN